MGCGDDLRWIAVGLRWVLVGLIEWVAVGLIKWVAVMICGGFCGGFWWV